MATHPLMKRPHRFGKHELRAIDVLRTFRTFFVAVRNVFNVSMCHYDTTRSLFYE